MKPLAAIHALESGQLRTILSERSRSFVTVCGESGVGKTTLIDAVLRGLSLSPHTLRYEVAGSKDPLKNYLNSIFSQYHSSSGIIQKAFGTEIQFSAARVGIGVPTSLSIRRNSRGITVELGTRRDQTHFVLKGAAYRLNGSAPPSFFRRLWALLRNQDIRVLWIANAELLPEAELNLFSGMCQHIPESAHVLIEVGGLVAQLEKRQHAIEFSTRSCPVAAKSVTLKPLGFGEAKQFHEAISKSMPIPTFDYAKNGGNPLSIIYDISFAQRKYAVSRTISRLTRSKAKRDTLLLLAALFGVVQDTERLFAIASGAGLNLDLKDFIDAGIVEHIGARLSLSHSMFPDFVLSAFRSAFRPLFKKMAPSLRKHDEAAYLYLLLRFATTIGAHINEEDWQLLQSTLIAAITNYEFENLTNLLPWISTIEDIPPNVRYVTEFVTAQYEVYNYEYNSSRIAGYTAPVETGAKMLLEAQSLYHRNRFAEAIALASSTEMLQTIASLGDPVQEQWAIAVVEALTGACQIALGQHDLARESLASARRLAPAKSSRGQYLLLLDSFLFGESHYLTHRPVSRSSIPNNYIRAKLNHNIYVSKVCRDYLAPGLPTEFAENVIAPFLAIDSQEVTYSYVNLGAMLIARGEIARAIDLLEQTKLRVFEIYDAISCLNNLIVARALNGQLRDAEINFEECLSTLKETQFNDPSFLLKPKLNMVIVAQQMGRRNDARELLEACELPPDHINRPILDRKRRLLSTLSPDIVEWRGAPDADIFSYLPFWIQILTFWDYNAPIIDAEFFAFTKKEVSPPAEQHEKNSERPLRRQPRTVVRTSSR